MIGRGQKRGCWGAGRILVFDLAGGHTGVCDTTPSYAFPFFVLFCVCTTVSGEGS